MNFVTPLDFLVGKDGMLESVGTFMQSLSNGNDYLPLDITGAFLANLFTSNSKVNRYSMIYVYISYYINWCGPQNLKDRYHHVCAELLVFIRSLGGDGLGFCSDYEFNLPKVKRPEMPEIPNMSPVDFNFDFSGISFTGTSGKFDPEHLLDLFDNALDKPQEIFSLLSFYNLKKIVTYLIFYQYVSPKMCECSKFFGLYDSALAHELSTEGDTIATITSVLKALSSITRTVYLGKLDYSESTDPIRFVEDVEWLRHYRFKCCNPEDLVLAENKTFISNVEWVEKCHSTYRRRLMIDTKRQTPSVATLVRQAINHLDDLYDSSFNVAEGTRPPPLVLGLTGDSGSGKTTFIAPHFSQIIQRVLGYKCDSVSDGFMVLNGNDPFLSSYNPNRDYVVLFDELGAYKNSDKNTNNVLNNSFLEMCTAGKFILNSAHLEEKGKREWKPRAIMVASNKDDFGLSEIINCPEAGFNRFTAIFAIKIKEKYRRKDDSGHFVGGIDIPKLKEARSLLEYEFESDAVHKEDYWPVILFRKKKELTGFSTDYSSPISFLEACKMVEQIALEHKKTIANHKTNTVSSIDNMTCSNCHRFNCTCMESTSGRFEHIPNPLPETSFISMLYYYFISYFLWFIIFICKTFTSSETLLLALVRIKIKTELEIKANETIAQVNAGRIRFREAINKLARDDYRFRLIKGTFQVVAVLSVVASAYYLIKKFIPKEYLMTETAGYTQEEREVKKKPNAISGRIPSKILTNSNNVWPSSNVNKIIFGKACCTPYDIVMSKVKANIYIANVFSKDNPDEKNYSHLFNIHDCYYICVGHWAAHVKDPNYQFEIFRPILSEENGSVACELSSIMLLDGNPRYVVDLENDLSLLYIPQLRPGKSMIDCMITNFGDYKYVDAENVLLTPGNTIKQDKFTGVLQDVKYKTKNDSFCYLGIVGHADTNSFDGRCGSPLISRVGTQMALLGFNTSGKVGTSLNGFSIITSQLVRSGIKTFESNSSLLSPVSTVPFDECDLIPEMEFTPTSRLSNSFWINTEDLGGITVHGQVAELNIQRPKSKVFKLKIYNDFFSIFPIDYQHTLGVPSFRSYSENGNYYGVYKNMLDQVAHQTHNVNLDHLDAVVNYLSNKFAAIEDFKNLEFWDANHACSGASYNPFCKAVPKSTAAGWPLNGKKIDHMVESDSPYAPEGYVPNKELHDRIVQSINLMKKGIRPMTVYKTCMKDEPRDLVKIHDRKIRVFTCAPIDQVIIQKMFFGNFMGIFTKNFLKTETVGGINCYSSEWGDVFKSLSIHPNVINGDYSKYDKKVSSIMISAAFSICYNIIDKHLNLDEETKLIFRSMLSDIAHPTLLMEKEFISLNGSLSSGIFLTFLLNNIMNSIYIRLAWLNITNAENYEASLLNFDDNVKFFAMGDDNTFSVSDKYVGIFNFANIQSYFHSIGMKYTNAAKTDDVYGSVPVTEATICKRKWLYSEEFDFYFCPIEKPSVGKMMTMALAEGPLSEDQKIQQSYISALYELAQYGRAEYNSRVADFEEIFGLNDIKIPVKFSYDEMVQKQINKGETPWTIPLCEVIECEDLVGTSLEKINKVKRLNEFL